MIQIFPVIIVELDLSDTDIEKSHLMHRQDREEVIDPERKYKKTTNALSSLTSQIYLRQSSILWKATISIYIILGIMEH